MKLISALLCITLLTVSCKKQDDKDTLNTDERFVFGKEISKVRVLEDGEFRLAKDMCSSLKKKREFFETRGDRELSFIFSVSEKKCISDSYSTERDYSANLRVPRVGELTFEGPRGANFTEDILTDIHPSLESICSDVLNDINVKNVVNSGSIKYQYRFLNPVNGYLLEIGKFVQAENGKYMPTFIETFNILSRLANQREGMVQSRIRVSSCSRGQSQSSRQVLK